MKTFVPTFCGLALAAMSAAGLCHWWSVDQFVAAVGTGLPTPMVKPASSVPPPSLAPAVAIAKSANNPAPTGDSSREKFYESLVQKMESLQNQNRDLLNQMAETNRDVMSLGFRVDTHSESFRPMPVSEERIETSFEDGPGVLPPRAEPVFLPSDE